MSNKKLLLAVTLSLLILIGVVGALIYKQKKGDIKPTPAATQNPSGKTAQKTETGDASGAVLVSTNEAIEKINLATGEKMPASALEQEDFSGFSGLPKLGDVWRPDIEQAGVLVSNDKSEAIVTVTPYDSSQTSNNNSDAQPVLSTDNYLCDIARKSCQRSDLLDQNYQGLDPLLQKNGDAFVWFKWDSAKKLLFGHILASDGPGASPVYACDIQNKACVKTEGYDSQKQGDARAVVPEGAVSPSLGKFVMVNQHDNPNVETGKQWDLLIYEGTDLSKPARSWDLSAIIDHDASVAYDSVWSVAWSSDEKKIAIGTTRRIFMFDVASGSLSLVYSAPADSDGDPYWDSSALFMSPDSKYIAFIDSSPDQLDDTDTATDQQTNDSSLNALNKIDLQDGNVVSEVLEEKGLGLKFE